MGGSSTSPTPYQPSNQAGADQSYQSLVSNASPWASALPSQVIPGLNSAATATQNNPYFGQALSGAQSAAGQATNTVAPGQFAGSAATGALGSMGTGLAGQTSQGGTLAPADLQMILNAIPGLTGGMGAANRVLQNGFDPQNAMYNRESQRSSDAANANNAMNGLAGSPYGAGVANEAATNFNIDWQNNQLGRQISALGAYGGEQKNVAENLTGLNSNAVGSYNALNAGAVSNFATAGGAAGQAYTTSSDLGRAGLNTTLSGGQAPSNVFLDQQNANISALGALASGASQSFSPTQGLVADQANYLNIGQSATAGAQTAVKENNATASAFGAALGQLGGVALRAAMGGF